MSGPDAAGQLAETLAAYERGEINVLINAMLLAEGWNSPRATVCMHLAPTASKRVYQQRIGRIMRTHPRKEAGIVVDFVPKGATHNERVVSLHSLLDADFYREGARVTPAPRRRVQRRARRRLTPASWLVPVTPDVKPPPRRDPARVAAHRPALPRRGGAAVLGDDRRPADPLRRARDVRAEADRRPRVEGGARAVPVHVRGGEPESPPADDGARRPRLDAGRARRLRRPRHARHPGADVGEGPDRRDPHPPARDRRRAAGRAGSDPRALDVEARAARRARCRTGARARSSRRRSGCSARSRTRAGTGTRRTPRSSSTPRSSCRWRSARRCSRRPRATRRARTSCSDAARGAARARSRGRRGSRRQPAGAEAGCHPACAGAARRKKKTGDSPPSTQATEGAAGDGATQSGEPGAPTKAFVAAAKKPLLSPYMLPQGNRAKPRHKARARAGLRGPNSAGAHSAPEP